MRLPSAVLLIPAICAFVSCAGKRQGPARSSGEAAAEPAASDSAERRKALLREAGTPGQMPTPDENEERFANESARAVRLEREAAKREKDRSRVDVVDGGAPGGKAAPAPR